jgi:hypothetical protein
MKPTKILKAASCPNWWLAAHSRLYSMVLVAMLVPLCQSPAHAAGTWVAFGPQTFVRGSGAPTQVTASFSVLNPNTVYVLRINNGGLNGEFARSSGVITLNGVRIFGPLLLNPLVPVLEWPVLLHSNNQLGIQLQGTTGSGIAVQVIGVDIKPPVISGTISPPPNAAGWNNSDVTVSFTCSDQTSGVASCSPPVVLTSEGAHQVVSGAVTDKAGNKVTTSVTVNLDKTPPTISGTINPPPDAAGWNSSRVTVSFGCSDQLSGMASCSPPGALNTEGANQIVTGTATDIAGNTATAQITVNISTKFFSVRNYEGKCLDYGTPWQGTGTTVFLNDCAVAHPIRVEEINDKHEVVLHAGTQVIGIYNPVQPVGIAPPPPRTEYALELQTYDPALASTANQIFRLDGDSIILEGGLPCRSTDDTLCPPPPPQLVVQILNARGANGSPLVAGRRNLADSEFWDFNAIDGSSKDPTSGFVHVATADGLWNAICASPTASAAGPPINSDGVGAPCAVPKAGWGSVIVISSPNDCSHVQGADPGEYEDIGTCIDLSAYAPLELQSGLTLRGDRRGTNLGPQLHASYSVQKYFSGICGWCMMEVRGDYVRVTGLRLHGQSRSTADIKENDVAKNTVAILVLYPLHYVVPGTGVDAQNDFVSTTEYISVIDHNDISDWERAGVEVDGGHHESLSCDGIVDDPATQSNVRIERNFLHHNQRQNAGYGAEMSTGGRALVSGNTFVSNRHAIASDGEAHANYRASYNLVLSQAPIQIGLGGLTNFYTHDFDMHGVGSNGFGGLAGNYVDILGNTFLGTNRHNYEMRGYPCHDTDFHANVSLQSKDEAVNFKPSETQLGTDIEYMNVADIPNQFEFPNPTDHLGMGDFDADRRDDLFLATGSAWYYAPAGNAEWRFLNAASDTIDQLLLGDFDGDGRTDVVAIHDGQFVISWGGISAWEVLNPDPTGGRLLLLPSAVTAMAVGDFDSNGIADIFWADGQTWWISYGGNTPFAPVNASSFLRTDLRFGDFDGDGATDVFGVVSNGQFNTWSYSKSATGAWADGFLQEALAPIDQLVVADFDGDGRADVATASSPDLSIVGFPSPDFVLQVTSWNWMFSHDGVSNWTSHQITPTNQCGLTFGQKQLSAGGLLVGTGRFAGNLGADILLWGVSEQDDSGNNFCIVSGGTGAAQRQSRQDMR